MPRNFPLSTCKGRSEAIVRVRQRLRTSVRTDHHPQSIVEGGRIVIPCAKYLLGVRRVLPQARRIEYGLPSTSTRPTVHGKTSRENGFVRTIADSGTSGELAPHTYTLSPAAPPHNSLLPGRGDATWLLLRGKSPSTRPAGTALPLAATPANRHTPGSSVSARAAERVPRRRTGKATPINVSRLGSPDPRCGPAVIPPSRQAARGAAHRNRAPAHTPTPQMPAPPFSRPREDEFADGVGVAACARGWGWG
ncbi:hypothetical protein C8Q77DRAFT_110314 [Trametes polyzona]|nr:hypothetical protein C8Q77DRAFT_110314 [Trametes polyzona]